MLSGLLVANSLFGKLRRGQRVNIIREVTERYLRFMPLMAALIIVSIFILPLLGTGPQWSRAIVHQSEICKQNWYRNILMIHNWFGFKNICMENTHHVGTDFELFVVAIFLIIFVHLKPKPGIFLIIALAVASTIARFYVVYVRELVIYITYGAK
jgi:peptidoglycan/LPS O-acetylase OafA/YrhL